MRNKTDTKLHLLAVLLISLIAVPLRFWRITSKPLHFDERASIGCSVGIPYAGIRQVGSSKWEDLGINSESFNSADFRARNNLAAVYEASLEDNGSIFYYVTLNLWTRVFGTSTLSYRSSSAVPGVVAVLLVYLLSYQVFRSRAGAFLAALFLAVHPMHIASSQFIRSHSLACVLTLLATLFLFRLLRQKNRTSLLLYSLTCILAMLSHYFTSYVFLGHLLFMLFTKHSDQQWKWFAVSVVISITLFGIWMVTGGLESMANLAIVRDQFQSVADRWREGDNPYFTPASARSISAGILQALLPVSGNWLQVYGLKLRVLLLPGVIFWGVMVFLLTRAHLAKYREVKLIAFPVAAYVLWAVGLSLYSRLIIYFQPAYALYIVPLFCILLGVLLNTLETKRRRMIAFALLAFQAPFWVFSLLYCYRETQETGNEHEERASTFLENKGGGGTLVHNDWEEAFLVNLHLYEHPEIRQRIQAAD